MLQDLPYEQAGFSERASLKLLNADHDLEFEKQLLGLLDVRAHITDDSINVKGVLRDDLPFVLNLEAADLHSPASWEERHSDLRPSR